MQVNTCLQALKLQDPISILYMVRQAAMKKDPGVFKKPAANKTLDVRTPASLQA